MIKSSMMFVLVTAPEMRRAKAIAQELLGLKLVACVNMLTPITSMYTWEGKVETAKEVLMILKTRKSLLKALCVAIKKSHPYTVPEIVAIPVDSAEKNYTHWLFNSTQSKGR